MNVLYKPRSDAGAFLPERRIAQTGRALAILLLTIVAAEVAAWGQCVQVRFTGAVRAQQTFEKKFTDRLLFRLAPARDGWTIEIRPAGDPHGVAEYSYIVTPPYRSANPRYIYKGWDVTTDAQVVSQKKRDFNFVLDRQDYLRADRDLNHILWMATEAQYRQALKDMAALPVGHGDLTITSSKIERNPAHANDERIAKMKFAVGLTIPAQLHVTPELRRAARETACPQGTM